MKEEDVRSWLARQFGWEYLPDELWEQLEEDVIEKACRGPEERQDLLKQARRRRTQSLSLAELISSGELSGVTTEPAFHESSAVDMRVAGTILGVPGPVEALDEGQTMAFSAIIAEEAARHPDVVEARERILRSRVLNDDQLLRFVMSPANRFLLFSDLESRGICPVEHDAKVIESSINDGITDVAVYPCHQEYTVESYARGHAESQRMTVEVQCRTQNVRVERNTKHKADVILYLAPVSKEPEKVGFGQITAWPGSVVSELLSVAEALSSETLWRGPEAFTFLLTGMFPVLSGVSSTVSYYPSAYNNFRYARINISAVPWASTEAVLAQFRAEQEFLLMSKKRSFSAKNLTLTTFVTNRLMLARLRQNAAPSWSVIRDEWNQRYPDWTYSEPNYLRNDYYRTRKRIQFYPSAFPETIEDELDRYEQLQSRIWFGPVFVNPAGDVS